MVDLALVIRHRLEDGGLPHIHTIELWRERGFGQVCDGCGLAITSSEWMRLICADDWRLIRLHENCFVLWEIERGIDALRALLEDDSGTAHLECHRLRCVTDEPKSLLELLSRLEQVR